MRILLVGDYPPDPRLGSAKVPLKLQEEFRALGHACDLLLADGIGSRPRNPYVRQALGPVVAYRATRRMMRARGPYDVVDVASAEGLWIAAARRAGFLGDTVVISRSHGLEHLNYQRMLDDAAAGLTPKPWTRRLFHPLVRLTQVAGAARLADGLLLLNDVDRDFALARRWQPASRVAVVPHGVSSVFLADVPAAAAPRGRGLLFCGSWIDMKGAPTIATAYSDAVAAGLDTPLTILGGAIPDERILASFAPAARRLVRVLPRLAEPDVITAYRSHDALVFASRYEGFGMVVVEAMSQRLPVIATPVGCARTLVEDGVSGLVVPPRDPRALARAMTTMMADAPLRARFADAAHERVRGMSWRATALATLAVYEAAGARRS